jgi:hypothetical protein
MNIEELIERLRDENCTGFNLTIAACEAADALEQLASAQKDAERYRFIRSNNRNYCPLCGYDGLDCYQNEELDAAIDAKMGEKDAD